MTDEFKARLDAEEKLYYLIGVLVGLKSQLEGWPREVVEKALAKVNGEDGNA